MDKLIKKGKHGEYHIGGIYKHYKGNYYKIIDLAKLHGSEQVYLVIYNQVDVNGVFVSIRQADGENVVFQPFATHETRWHDNVLVDNQQVKRFTLIN